ncbi:MAG: hypothetical protein NW207_04390 [Cytophagales bacterium]|nr:hypothetical protein [Cytophagales bacterium]
MELATMQLSDWFTVVTILIAVLAFYKPEERKLLMLKIGTTNLLCTSIILCVVIPFLLYYDRLICYYFNSCVTILASDWAFIVLISLVAYWVWWFYFKLKKQAISDKIIQFYKDSINTLPFDELLRLFIKYEVPIEKSSDYATLLSDSIFYNAALQINSKFILNEFKKMDSITLLNHRIPRIIRDEMLVQIAVQKRMGTLSAYNQEPSKIGSEFDNLILFKLLDCYFVILNTCIRQNNFSHNGFNIINRFLPTIFKEILFSINVNTDINLEVEAPTYNHKLLNKILSYFSDVLSDNLVINHFAEFYCDCILRLFERNDVVKLEYIKIQFNYFLNTYFKYLYSYEEIRKSINNKVIENIKNSSNSIIADLFSQCWEYSDNDIFNDGNNISNDEMAKRDYFSQNVVNNILN